MDFSQNYEKLLKQMNYKRDEGKVKHNNFKGYSPLLPFQTRHPERVKFDNGFNSILGEFTRIELNKKWTDNLDLDKIVTDILCNDSVITNGYDEKLEVILRQYLFNDNELNILNPYLFSYIPLSDNKQSVGEKDIALFLRDIFCQDNQELVDFFEINKSNHAIINLILSNITKLDDKISEKRYKSFLNNIVDLFNEDINFAIKHEKFLINNISNIFVFYYFIYISQLILKLNKDYHEYDENIEELYFLLDWESVSKNRKTVNGYGWHFLKSKSNNLAAKISVVDQLNVLLGTENYSLLSDIHKHYKMLDIHEQKEFIEYLKKWVYDYRIVRGFDSIILPNNLEELTNILFESLNDKKGIDNKISRSSYPLNLEEVTKNFFAKRRGRYGLVLNITRDLLLTVTALCVKDKKIKLNQLFNEYEKRGLFFDKYSKEEIESFLTKLNLIDKKSDSGDAKYVRPIL